MRFVSRLRHRFHHGRRRNVSGGLCIGLSDETLPRPRHGRTAGHDDHLPICASWNYGRKEDETWSQWILARQRADLSPVPEPERMAVCYRVRELKK